MLSAMSGRSPTTGSGSILCEKKGSSASPRVVLDAHLDEVAFLVQSISDEGKLGLVPLGGWWGHVLLAQRMDIIVAGGKAVPGVVGSKPPHFLKPEEQARVIEPERCTSTSGPLHGRRSRPSACASGIPSCLTPSSSSSPSPMPSSKAFDNRVGVGLLCEALLGLRERAHPNTVIGVGAVQEEIGCRGARDVLGALPPGCGHRPRGNARG